MWLLQIVKDFEFRTFNYKQAEIHQESYCEMSLQIPAALKYALYKPSKRYYNKNTIKKTVVINQ